MPPCMLVINCLIHNDLKAYVFQIFHKDRIISFQWNSHYAGYTSLCNIEITLSLFGFCGMAAVTDITGQVSSSRFCLLLLNTAIHIFTVEFSPTVAIISMWIFSGHRLFYENIYFFSCCVPSAKDTCLVYLSEQALR